MVITRYFMSLPVLVQTEIASQPLKMGVCGFYDGSAAAVLEQIRDISCGSELFFGAEIIEQKWVDRAACTNVLLPPPPVIGSGK